MLDSQTPNPRPQTPITFAQSVLDAEANAIGAIQLDASFEKAVGLIAGLQGSLVVSGLGKSGLIGAKLSATFASTGTPSHVLHPVEALHGDIGKVRQGDAVLMLSNGGGTEEVLTLAMLLKQDNIPTLAIVGRPGSELGRLADVTLAIGDITEACPHNLAPSASTTAMLALGDAIALTVMQQRNFTADDFHKAHPSGGLGKQLMPVTQAMRFKCVGEDANMPLIALDTTMQDAYKTAEQSASDSGLRRAGALLVVDPAGKLAGIVTDGDLRSALINTGPEVWTGIIDSVMTKSPTTLNNESLVRDAVHIVREKRFDEIPVVDSIGRPIGIIDVQDLAALKVIEG
ncbi:MAG: KpsF/GutQ family sugar-phosphate isomerase [Phycisphaeraceae bacterium]|nr:KpsF/GutQ family sugar-phosphate isomerase [Phycisphaeraceae bacterium]